MALRLIPGDPVLFLLGEESVANAHSPAAETLRLQLGLNLSPMKQFLVWLKELSQLDLGTSLIRKTPVRELIAPRLAPTLVLGFASIILANFLALALNFFVTFVFRTKHQNLARLQKISLFCEAIPVFWLAPLLVFLFSFHGPGLPVAGLEGPKSFVLPLIALSLGFCGFLFRTSSTLLDDILRADFIRTAKAKGLSSAKVFLVHAVPHLLPALSILSFQHLGHLFAGALITETLFDWPGLGSLLFESISSRDYPVVQSIILLSSAGTVVLNELGERLALRFMPEASANESL